MAELIFWTPAAVVALVVIVIIFCILYDVIVSIYVTLFPPEKPTEYAFQQLLNIETQAVDMFFLYIVYGGIIAALGTYVYMQVTGIPLVDMLKTTPVASPPLTPPPSYPVASSYPVPSSYPVAPPSSYPVAPPSSYPYV